jgi:GT2 family glycosyltransferase
VTRGRDLTIVIPTYRRREELRRTLRALAGQSAGAASFEVIVVDDPHEDDSVAVAEVLAPFEGVLEIRHLHRPSAGNASSARNAGFRAASAELILFLGDDIIGDRDLVSEHLEWHRRRPEEEVGVLGHVRWAKELRRTPFMAWLDGGIQFDFARLEGGEAGWGMLYTSNASLKRSTLERVGGFDEERFPFLYEDTDLGYRLAQQGFRLLYNPAARAQHLHSPRLEDWRARMADTARAERRFVVLHPERDPYFERLFRDAASQPPRSARLARALLPATPRSAPVFGSRIWWRADLHFRQQLAPDFLAAWDAPA